MFEKNGYEVVKNFISEDFVEFIQSYFYTRILAGDAQLGDIQAPNSFLFYSDPLMDTILRDSAESFSKIVGYDLTPTYSYVRLYGDGDELKIHTDRESCEFSATLALGLPEGTPINPIYFSHQKNDSDAIEIILNPGDLCLYRGCDLYHWRPPFEQKWYLQGFLHYVDKNGKYKNRSYDGRSALATKYIF